MMQKRVINQRIIQQHVGNLQRILFFDVIAGSKVVSQRLHTARFILGSLHI